MTNHTNIFIIICISFICFSSCKKDNKSSDTATAVPASRLLNIPARLQWENDDGYCGEASLQMAGLYYGNYISQDVCRTLTGGWFLVGDTDSLTLDKLSFTYEDWDFDSPEPQYKNYLVWVKQHLNRNHPVLITSFVKGMSYPDYDHIMIAIGFSSGNLYTFNDNDVLMFNDCFSATYSSRTFKSLWDTRSMTGNGAVYEYCIPKFVNFGCAITGNKDVQHITRPVHITLDRWDEPNVTLGEAPVMLSATITVDSLTSGEKYALLRYNNYTTVPSSGFDPTGASDVSYFIASGNSKTLSDSIMSNTAVFYRCIPYDF